MNHRIDKAIKEYEKKFYGTAKGNFTVRDLYEIKALTEDQSIYDALYEALKAGFVIGYRCSCGEIAKAQRDIVNG